MDKLYLFLLFYMEATIVNEEYSALWSDVLTEIKSQVNEPSFNTWFTGTELVACQDQDVTIKAANDIAKTTLGHIYREDIINILRDLTGKDYVLSFKTQQDLDKEDKAEKHGNLPEKEETNHNFRQLIEDYRLNPKYTFDNFVIGKGNQYAHATSLAIAESMAHDINAQKFYNPLFIYGGSGLGKTHLMQAIAHYVLIHQPDAKIKYISSETFTNELIDSIMRSKTAQFRAKYRTCDILLIDDVQFLSSKEGTQEEFFHTFNELYEANKQIIIASDRPPKEIPKLEERLRTRFEWGIISDVQKPDLETRIAILRKKAEMDQQSVPNDVIFYMAENIQSNIRELEGALLNLTAFAALNNQPLTVDMARDFLSSYIKVDTKPVLSCESIQALVCETYGVKRDELVGKRRSQNIVKPRQIAMYLCRELTDLSLPKIGELFGGRDHTTVMHAVEKVNKLIEKDPVLKGSINGLQRDLLEK